MLRESGTGENLRCEVSPSGCGELSSGRADPVEVSPSGHKGTGASECGEVASRCVEVSPSGHGGTGEEVLSPSGCAW